jgi:PST family polysaccharide transporter
MNFFYKNNFLSLFFLQFLQSASYLIPVITIPYLTNVLGIELFGKYSFSQSVAYYFSIIVLYSFDIIITRDISIHKNDFLKIQKVFSSAIIARLLLFIACLIIFLILLFFLADIRDNALDFFIAFMINLGWVFTPTWLFLGIGKSTQAALINFFSKIIFSILIFILVKNKNDYIYVNLSQTFAQVVVALILLVYIKRRYGFQLFSSSIKDAIHVIFSGWSFFKTSLVITLYTATNPIILGIYASNTQVGIYSFTYKVISVLTGFVVIPLNMIVFPKVTELFTIDKLVALKYVYKVSGYVIFFALTITLSVFLFSDYIYFFFQRNDDKYVIDNTILCFKISSLTIAFIAMSNIFGYQILIPLKKEKYLFYICLIVALFSNILTFVFSKNFGGLGVIAIWTTSEFLIMIGFGIFAYRQIRKLIS